MDRTRRQFLTSATIGLAGLVAGCLDTSSQSEEGRGATSRGDTETTTARSEQTAVTENSITNPSPKTVTNTVSSTPSVETHETTGTVTRYDHSVTDLKIWNETSNTLTVTVTITRLSKPVDTSFTATSERPQFSGETVLTETFELKPSIPPEYETKVYQNPIKPGPSYAITIEVRDGPTGTYFFGEYDDSKGLLVRIHKQSIEFGSVIA